MAVEVIERLLNQILPPIDSVHDLQRLARTRLFADRGHKAHELFGLLGESETQEGIDSECRIPDPGVAVVPVTSAANDFRQAARGRCNDRASGFVRQQFESEGGTVNYFAPPAGVPGMGEPSLPKCNGSAEQLLGLVERHR